MNLLRQWYEFLKNDPDPDSPAAVVTIAVLFMALLWTFALVTPN